MRISVYITLQILFRELDFGGGLQTSHLLGGRREYEIIERAPTCLSRRQVIYDTDGWADFYFSVRNEELGVRSNFFAPTKEAAAKMRLPFFMRIKIQESPQASPQLSCRCRQRKISFSANLPYCHRLCKTSQAYSDHILYAPSVRLHISADSFLY